MFKCLLSRHLLAILAAFLIKNTITFPGIVWASDQDSTVAASSDIADNNIVHLENQFLSRTWTTHNGVLVTTQIQNKWAKLPPQPVSGEEFRLRISETTEKDGTDRLLTSKDFKVQRVERSRDKDADTVTFTLDGADFKVLVKVWLFPNDFYLRKQLTLTPKHKVTLEQIDVESLGIPDSVQPYQQNAITADAPANWRPNLGQPLYGEKQGTFWGIEFPAATNRVAKQVLYCGYPVGRELPAGASLQSYAAVMGVSDDPQFVQDTFLDYIDRIRVRPFHLQTQYNSWFDWGGSVNADKFKQSVTTIHHELVQTRGVRPFDAYVIDDGWQDMSVSWANNYWPVNKKFDADLASSFQTAHAAESNLGLWMNPACEFGARGAIASLRKAGYEALDHRMSLAGPKHMTAYENRMVDLTKLGVRFFKLDGIFGHLNQREFELHGGKYGLPEMPQLEAGSFAAADKRLNDSKYDELKLYYLCAATERLMHCLDEVSQTAPKVHSLLSNAAYLSPWWLQHADTVWIINSGDYASDRLLYQTSVQEKTQFPLNAIFNHEPQVLKSAEPDTRRRYMYSAFARGTGFLELYLTPRSLKTHDWDVVAESLIWTEMTGAAFKRSRMHGGDPAKKETYGFTGWSAEGGYVSIHNAQKGYEFKLDRKLGVVPGSGPFQVSSPFESDLIGLQRQYNFGDVVRIPPSEQVVILNFSNKPLDWSRVKKLQSQAKEHAAKE